MKKLVAMMAVLATAGLLAACNPGRPVSTTVGETHTTDRYDNRVQTSAPVQSDKYGRTFEAQ